jgi:hypothetical protein
MSTECVRCGREISELEDDSIAAAEGLVHWRCVPISDQVHLLLEALGESE